MSFWTSCEFCSGLAVMVDGTTVGTLNSYFNSAPVCGQSGTVTVTKAPGTYAYTARDTTGRTWGGTITVAAGSCGRFELYSNDGQVGFWTSCPDCAGLQVTLGGQVIGTLTHYYSSTPTCGQSGVLTVVRAPGTYPYTARDNSGRTWSGTVTVPSRACFRMELRGGTSPGSGFLQSGGD